MEQRLLHGKVTCEHRNVTQICSHLRGIPHV
ncbi:rCG50872 [Rattus norvegicus]|uniref:RCG50872 n=1 Tax=Rattus norvegicus TaxID=10116 RepID=A6KJ61_RAT|nr:rCG50872 [Rattus norvegicus]